MEGNKKSSAVAYFFTYRCPKIPLQNRIALAQGGAGRLVVRLEKEWHPATSG